MTDIELKRIRRSIERLEDLTHDAIARGIFVSFIGTRYFGVPKDRAHKFRIDMLKRSNGTVFDEVDDFTMWINMIPITTARVISTLDEIDWFTLRELDYFVDSIMRIYDAYDFRLF